MGRLSNFDYSKKPLIYIKYTDINASLQDLEEHLQQLENTHLQHEEAIVIHDIEKLKYASAELRIRAGHWIKDNNEKFSKKNHTWIIITPSIVSSMVLKGVLLVSKPPFPTHVFSTVDEAMKFATEKIASFKTALNTL